MTVCERGWFLINLHMHELLLACLSLGTANQNYTTFK